jgi:hypothetical protein
MCELVEDGNFPSASLRAQNAAAHEPDWFYKKLQRLTPTWNLQLITLIGCMGTNLNILWTPPNVELAWHMPKIGLRNCKWKYNTVTNPDYI